MEKEEKGYEEARKIARDKVSFIRHGITYVSVMVVLAVINNVASPGYQWWLWPALGWGIGVFFHFIGAFVSHKMSLKRLEEHLTQKELDRMKDEK